MIVDLHSLTFYQAYTLSTSRSRISTEIYGHINDDSKEVGFAINGHVNPTNST